MAYTADKVIKVALNEVGYIEKKSNSQLDNKTANAGSSNYTKYARDLDKISGFYNGRKNGFDWCDIFVDWCFVTAFGVNKAKELLCQPSKSCGAGCYYSMNYYKNKGQLHSKPVAGDQIFFKNGSNICHTGLVYDVDKYYVYTVEGNTSGASGVIANGGGVCKKKYELSSGRIAGYGRPKYDKPQQTSTNVSNDYLMFGDKGAKVKEMQKNLIKLGYSCGSSGADGDFGANTESALRKFQKENGLVVNGKYDEKSKSKVNSLLKKTSTSSSSSSTSSSKPTSSSTGKIDTVKEVQKWANTNYKSGLVIDGIYGANTKNALVKILQIELNQTYKTKLVVDGIFGNNTKSACPSLKTGSKNDVVGVLQALLICNGYKVCLDKNYGSTTVSAVKSYQGKKKLVVDGIVGKNTFAKLCS